MSREAQSSQSEGRLSPLRGDLRGIDESSHQVLADLREIARARARLDARESELIARGLSLDVPVTWMSRALGLGATTLGMRMKAGRR